ncbi:unnamed protein product [Oncorhynchus mykiss]|uniref:Sulfotransferase n=1 Tax=Oncorhynchus mykiss TaxID=8022 RepID=A0A060XU50_ONCMY|nr:unnamed protein product [Oncorhynchus mykiss]
MFVVLKVVLVKVYTLTVRSDSQSIIVFSTYPSPLFRELMPKTLEGQITMEKTPSYFVTREAPARISAMSRDTKLIVLGRVQDFLGLKRIITDKHFYFNQTKGFSCLKKAEGSSKPHCLGKTKGRTHPNIHPEVVQRLRDFYRPFNRKFYQMTGRMFGWDD